MSKHLSPKRQALMMIQVSVEKNTLVQSQLTVHFSFPRSFLCFCFFSSLFSSFI